MRAAASMAVVLLASSCVLFGTRRSNQTLARITTWKGAIAAASAPEGTATFVVLLREGKTQWEQQSSRLFYGEGTFEILSRPQQPQQLFAFVDLNADQQWEPDEPSALTPVRSLADGEVADAGTLAPVLNGPKPPGPVNLAAGAVSEE